MKLYDSAAASRTASGQGQSATQAGAPGVQPNLILSSANYCAWRTGQHSMPLASADPLSFFIDNRCVLPFSDDPSNPAADFTTGIHNGPDLSDPHVADVKDGDKVLALCWTLGQPNDTTLATNPPAHVDSGVWLRVRAVNGTVGYLSSSFTAGGSYSRQQLIGLGLARCS